MAAERETTRRELLRALARWTSLGLLAGGGALLLRRNGDAESCTLRIPCASCALRRGCELQPSAPRERDRARPEDEES